MSTDEQAVLGMTGERHIDEYGEADKWGRGGVYDAAGKFDLSATQNRLTERFAPVRDRLPETVGEFERRPARHEYAVRYVSESEGETANGVRVDEREVRVFPIGPYFHRWTCSIEETFAESGGTRSRHHPEATNRDEIGPAVATALAVMRGEDREPREGGESR